MLLFRVFNIYKQGKDLKEDPVKFGVDLGRDAIAPLFVVPVIMLAVLSLGTLALWWWVGWGIFIFLSILFAIGILIVHSMYKMIAKVSGRAESSAHTQFDKVAQRFTDTSSNTKNHEHIVDTIAQEQ